MLGSPQKAEMTSDPNQETLLEPLITVVVAVSDLALVPQSLPSRTQDGGP